MDFRAPDALLSTPMAHDRDPHATFGSGNVVGHYAQFRRTGMLPLRTFDPRGGVRANLDAGGVRAPREARGAAFQIVDGERLG